MDGWVGSGDHASRVVEFGLGATRVSTGIGRGAGGMMGGTEMKVPISGTWDSSSLDTCWELPESS